MNKTILVVEDNEDLRELMCTSLRRARFDVQEAENGQVALDLIEGMAEPPCLVLLDLMMPVMSGTELLARLRESGRLASLSVVVASAVADRFRPQGAVAYVIKPVGDELLQNLLARFC